MVTLHHINFKKEKIEILKQNKHNKFSKFQQQKYTKTSEKNTLIGNLRPARFLHRALNRFVTYNTGHSGQLVW